ncbi:hypothetical protein COO60DRAFT_661762 [Scenedesmus sp. NREL 46B-D3]|nr:hypothetical protein COO60DRAFT_661762 [Scenedesmus sp. NREL 46B-D3]
MEPQMQQQEIHVQVIGDHGLVWSVPDIMKLRTDHRLVGCMVGGIAGFKSQVSVGGLPLKLSPEEVTLALTAGEPSQPASRRLQLQQQRQQQHSLLQ